MKTRQGFVSNSSSSSFIIKTEKNTWDVAQLMLRQREDDRRGSDIGESIDVEERIRQIENLNLPIDTPFTMHSCNYETYIFKQSGKVYVDTCNNHPWDLSDVGEWAGKSEHEGEGLDDLDYTKELFFHMDYLIVAREPEWEDRQNKKCDHWSLLKLPDGSIVCPECNPPTPITPFKIEVTPKINRIDLID